MSKRYKLPPPESQVQEVLYELINRHYVDRRSMMLSFNILNLPARIENLRDKGVEIRSDEITVFNKWGRYTTYVHYRLKDKAAAVIAYKNMKENQCNPKNKNHEKNTKS